MSTIHPRVSQQNLAGNFAFVTALGLLAAMSATAVDIVLPATPALERAFAIGAPDAQLVVTAYIAGMTLGLIPIGLLADRIGRRPVILACVTLFTLAGALTLVPLSFSMLLTLRFLQGACGAAGPALSRAIVRDVDGPNSGAHLMAAVTAILSIAPLVGPMLGGFLVDTYGWRAPFWSSAVYGLVTLATIVAWLPETRRYPPDSKVAKQIRDAVGLILNSPRAKTAISLFTLPFIGYFAILTSLSAVMHDLYEVPAARFGLLFALSATTYFLGAIFTRRLLAKFTAAQVLPIGIGVLCVTGLLTLTLIFWAESPAWMLWFAVSSYMLGMAISLPITTMEALAPLARFAGFGASILGTFQIGMGALGSFISANFYNGTQVSMCAVAAASAIGAVLIYLLRRRTLFE